jgi:hypothetical protein
MSLKQLLEKLKSEDKDTKNKAIGALKKAVQDAVDEYNRMLYPNPEARPNQKKMNLESQAYDKQKTRADKLLENFNAEMNESRTCNILQVYAETPNKAVKSKKCCKFPLIRPINLLC